MSELTNNKTEIGQENVYYEMEYKGENEDGTYEKVIVKNESPQERLRERAQPYKDSGEVKSRYFLFVGTAIAIASLLTAAATMVLAFAMTNSRSDVSTTRESCCEMSEINKNLQELKNNFSAPRESSVSKKLRELDVALANMKKELEIMKKKVNNVSKVPGPIGPPGYNGSEGPASRSGSSDFSQCQFEIKSASMIPGSNRILVHIDEPSNKRIMAVTCSTDYGTEYNLMSRTQGGVRRYVCTCNGKSTLFSGGTSCYLNYWICPLTT
ncbi:unnamed protein product [Pocillopora meandrina]|uniref:Uncharacterized protein n=1 Tax=Pocillopora meandrina TaxID=46732 RepID=A0AAU9W3I9_9CNID|nr:unnamed protein product [Pocillopora meandrina]